MADDLTLKGKADRDRINRHETWEVSYWCTKWNISKEVLLASIDAVGVMAADVESHLRRRGYIR